MIEHESRVKKYSPQQESHQELPAEHEDVFITFLHSVPFFRQADGGADSVGGRRCGAGVVSTPDGAALYAAENR